MPYDCCEDTAWEIACSPVLPYSQVLNEWKLLLLLSLLLQSKTLCEIFRNNKIINVDWMPAVICTWMQYMGDFLKITFIVATLVNKIM